MLILYVAMRHDYGDPARGLSFEHCTFFDFLWRSGHDILYFDFVELAKAHGRDGMNRLLLEVARVEKPDLVFTVLFKDEIDAAAMRRISGLGQPVTMNWFCDDHWRFESFSRRWAPCFNWVVTTAASALPKYARIGYRTVIKSQWACNHFMYRRLDLPTMHDASFVGQPHGNRREIIESLSAAGVDVRVWGHDWPSGRLSQEDMIGVFNTSRINLNLANASTGPEPRRLLSEARSRLSDLLGKTRVGRAGLEVARSLRRGTTMALRAVRPSAAGRAAQTMLPEQIKGRCFEVPGCGGFLLTSPAENLADYYEDGREIVCFSNLEDLIAKVRYYLDHEEARSQIAHAGFERTLREHTYAHRFAHIFAVAGLPSPPLDEVLAGKPRPGAVKVVE